MTNSEHKWAVVEAGGKQHVARVGKKIVINQIENKEGEVMTFADMLTKQPVQLKVIRHFLGEKVNGLKFKNKVRYLKRYGHRQHLTELEVVSLVATQQQKPEPKKAAVKPKTTKAPVNKVKNV